MAQSTRFGSTQALIALTLVCLVVDSHLVFMVHQIKQGLVPPLILDKENSLHCLQLCQHTRAVLKLAQQLAKSTPSRQSLQRQRQRTRIPGAMKSECFCLSLQS